MCGYPHPEHLLAVLSRDQMMEIEAMREIEPIGGEWCPVSRPPVRPLPAPQRNRILSAMLDPGKE
jgi:hypothetical protein